MTIPDSPPITDAEHKLIAYLKAKLDSEVPDWSVRVSLASSQRTYETPLVTVKSLLDATVPESVTNELDRVDETIEVRVFADTPARKRRLLNKIRELLQDTSGGLEPYCWLKVGTGANLDTLSMAEGIYQSTINVMMTRFEIPGEDII